jgi:hypothetical protein
VISVEDATAAITVALIAAVPATLAAILGWRNRRAARDAADYIDTGNGHTAGQSLSRIEEAAWRIEHRVDRVEVKIDELRKFTRENRDRIEELEDGD